MLECACYSKKLTIEKNNFSLFFNFINRFWAKRNNYQQIEVFYRKNFNVHQATEGRQQPDGHRQQLNVKTGRPNVRSRGRFNAIVSRQDGWKGTGRIGRRKRIKNRIFRQESKEKKTFRRHPPWYFFHFSAGRLIRQGLSLPCRQTGRGDLFVLDFTVGE